MDTTAPTIKIALQTGRQAKAKLDRVEGAFAVLAVDQGGVPSEAKIPMSIVPEGVVVGANLVLHVSTQEREEEEKYKRMRALLEELIN